MLSLTLVPPQIGLKAFSCTWRLYLESQARLSELATWPGCVGLCQASLGVLLGGNREPLCCDSSCGSSQMGLLSENNSQLNSRHLVHLDRVLWIIGIHAQIHLWKIHPGPSREIAENRGESPANLSQSPVLDCRAKAACPWGWILPQNICQSHSKDSLSPSPHAAMALVYLYVLRPAWLLLRCCNLCHRDETKSKILCDCISTTLAQG